eukprot:Blabericola_migrator_1__1814@NODE_1492_length_4427_cov_71_271789_g979_i0_p1_GENE_NODE_1492_length_4427_cov_71_271789_g979_i0NODE_1492_length_4427_cov_71_271789_g979_i0_p1_ORF_typecomplete_len655_score54_70zfRING_2/PF13639_6/9_8e11zfC3HC4_2/PF13923_6/1_1e08zfrbx1/PF12678_7/3_5e08zfC3HC4_3/PF13920_6/4_5e08zfANAPC11/PF12861_7/4_2e03zfANAPC11/PF12861_7/5_4e07zfRING_5/PF14634_6/4_9e07ProkRING_4/PF14447_6/7_8e06DUF2921/PF11145_8/7_6e05zfC3HC4/PF00097_25/0_00054zfRING_11/PF17123_5/0_0011FANCL_C/PF11793
MILGRLPHIIAAVHLVVRAAHAQIDPTINNAATCPSIPTVSQMSGYYAGFAVFQTPDTNRHRDGAPSNSSSLKENLVGSLEGVFSRNISRDLTDSVWTARCNVIKSNNLFWQAYVAKFQLQDDNGHVIDFVTRGIRPSNSHVAFVKGSSLQLRNEPEDDSNAVLGFFKGLLEFTLGSDGSGFSPSTGFGEGDLNPMADSHNEEDDDGSGDSEEEDEARRMAEKVDLLGDSMRCQVSGTIERFSFQLESDDTGPPLEVGSRTFQRSPDLIARLTLGVGCKGAGRIVSFSMRKFDVSFFKVQQTTVGIFVGLKTMVEILLLGRQFKRVEAQRTLLRTSWMTVAWSIIVDAFEAGFFFGRQSLGNDVSLLSSLAIVGLLKIVLVAVIEMRWLIVLQRARSTQRSQLEGDDNPLAWVKDMNRFIRWFAVFVVITLFLAARIFESYPEPVMLLLSLFLVPQILQNVWAGTRHPFQSSFVFGIAAARFVFPCLLWSKTGEELRLTQPPKIAYPYKDAWPSWFTSPTIPPMFLDSIFGTIPRRPNSWMLTIISVILTSQAVYLWLQNVWSPRAGLPPWFCSRFLPVVFDYELDVARVAASKQQEDPTITMVDCVICMTGVKFADRECVVTPCEHFFHKECLIKWMDVKLECPTCRRPLPPM